MLVIYVSGPYWIIDRLSYVSQLYFPVTFHIWFSRYLSSELTGKIAKAHSFYKLCVIHPQSKLNCLPT